MKRQGMKVLNYSWLAIIASLSSCTQSKVTDEINHPNIVYVLADDLGYGDLSSFNSDSKIQTPNLDVLAAEGMRFTDAHTSSSVCTPTRYGILTGRYNWRTTLKRGVLWGESPALIPGTRKTVASVLQDAGYETAFIGKWHLGWDWERNEAGDIDFTLPVKNTPITNGFDYAYGHCGSLDMPPYVYVENGMATSVPVDSTENADKQGFWRKGLTAPDFVHSEVTPHFFNKGMEFIKERAKLDKPFFLYLPLPSPHTPILPTEEWQGKSGLNPYGDFVMMVDAYMGQLNRAIKEAGIEENTLVVFTSDNGCSPRADFEMLASKDHYPSANYRGSKADIFEGGHRVPFIAKWPKMIKGGEVCEKTICTTDFMATSAAIVNYALKENEGEDSYSMLPLFSESGSDQYERQSTVHHSIDGSFAIRKDDWKLILAAGSGGWSEPNQKSEGYDELPDYQLYNLVNDPAEQKNLYGTNPELENELIQLMTNLIREGRSTPGVAQENDEVESWPQINWLE